MCYKMVVVSKEWYTISILLRHTISQISDLKLYPSLWFLVPGSSSQFFHNCFLYSLLLRGALVSRSVIHIHVYLWEIAARFCKLWEPLLSTIIEITH